MRDIREEFDVPLWQVERTWLRYLGASIWFIPVLFFNLAGYIALSLTMTIEYTFKPICKGELPTHRERIERILK